MATNTDRERKPQHSRNSGRAGRRPHGSRPGFSSRGELDRPGVKPDDSCDDQEEKQE